MVVSKETSEVSRKREFFLTVIMGGLFIGQIALCIVAFNNAHLDMIMYLGWVVLLIAFLLGGSARRTFEAKGGAEGQESWLETQNLVDSGVYAAIRHPIYLCFMLIIVSFMMIAQHWLSVFLGIPLLAFLYFGTMKAEERHNLKKFGEAYRDYMKRVPRINIVLGIIQIMRKKDSV